MGIGVIQFYGGTVLRLYKGEFFSQKCQNASDWNGCMYNYHYLYLNRTKIPQKIVSERYTSLGT